MICIGHSHAACVVNAAERDGVNLRAIVLTDASMRHVDGIGRENVLVDPEWSEVEGILSHGEGPIYSFVGGRAHIALGTRRHPKPFDLIVPEKPDLPVEADAEIIPWDVMRAVLR